ncbi:MAG: hypothetical protein JRK53_22980 [Deltaproteobacteria bacterium]|nr:hypothetical protein [Deltaproteobacteria bacterium]MBW1819632.1 hypothetical protein [Deltaproteobacteria bacterium]
MPKTRLNVSLDQDLAEFARVFAAENRTSVADMVTQYLLALKRRVEGEDVEKILAHPAFQQAIEEAQEKLWAGAAKWHSYDEVFGD